MTSGIDAACRGPAGRLGQRRMMSVDQHDVGAGQDRAQVRNVGDFGRTGVNRDHRALRRAPQHGDRRDRHAIHLLGRQVDEADPARVEVGSGSVRPPRLDRVR